MIIPTLPYISKADFPALPQPIIAYRNLRSTITADGLQNSNQPVVTLTESWRRIVSYSMRSQLKKPDTIFGQEFGTIE